MKPVAVPTEGRIVFATNTRGERVFPGDLTSNGMTYFKSTSSKSWQYYRCALKYLNQEGDPVRCKATLHLSFDLELIKTGKQPHSCKDHIGEQVILPELHEEDSREWSRVQSPTSLTNSVGAPKAVTSSSIICGGCNKRVPMKKLKEHQTACHNAEVKTVKNSTPEALGKRLFSELSENSRESMLQDQRAVAKLKSTANACETMSSMTKPTSPTTLQDSPSVQTNDILYKVAEALGPFQLDSESTKQILQILTNSRRSNISPDNSMHIQMPTITKFNPTPTPENLLLTRQDHTWLPKGNSLQCASPGLSRFPSLNPDDTYNNFFNMLANNQQKTPNNLTTSNAPAIANEVNELSNDTVTHNQLLEAVQETGSDQEASKVSELQPSHAAKNHDPHSNKSSSAKQHQEGPVLEMVQHPQPAEALKKSEARPSQPIAEEQHAMLGMQGKGKKKKAAKAQQQQKASPALNELDLAAVMKAIPDSDSALERKEKERSKMQGAGEVKDVIMIDETSGSGGNERDVAAAARSNSKDGAQGPQVVSLLSSQTSSNKRQIWSQKSMRSVEEEIEEQNNKIRHQQEARKQAEEQRKVQNAKEEILRRNQVYKAAFRKPRTSRNSSSNTRDTQAGNKQGGVIIRNLRGTQSQEVREEQAENAENAGNAGKVQKPQKGVKPKGDTDAQQVQKSSDSKAIQKDLKQKKKPEAKNAPAQIAQREEEKMPQRSEDPTHSSQTPSLKSNQAVTSRERLSSKQNHPASSKKRPASSTQNQAASSRERPRSSTQDHATSSRRAPSAKEKPPVSTQQLPVETAKPPKLIQKIAIGALFPRESSTSNKVKEVLQKKKAPQGADHKEALRAKSKEKLQKQRSKKKKPRESAKAQTGVPEFDGPKKLLVPEKDQLPQLPKQAFDEAFDELCAKLTKEFVANSIKLMTQQNVDSSAAELGKIVPYDLYEFLQRTEMKCSNGLHPKMFKSFCGLIIDAFGGDERHVELDANKELKAIIVSQEEVEEIIASSQVTQSEV